MERKSLMLGIIAAVAVLTACGEKATQGAQGREQGHKTPATPPAQKEPTPPAPLQEGTAPQAGQPEGPGAETASASAEPSSASGPGVDPKTGQKYLYKTDTYMVLSENPTVIQAIPKKPTPEELEAWRKERESLPLVSEVMTEEELKAYMKQKNISLVTKENFKVPELVWERNFDEEIKHTGCLSDLTEKGNSLLLAGDPAKYKLTLLFLDPTGKTRKKVAADNTLGETIDFAMGGNAAIFTKSEAVGPVEEGEIGIERVSATYYDEEGKEVWSRPDLVTSIQMSRFYLSHDGSMFCFSEANPHWGAGEYSLMHDLNCATLYFFNSAGERVLEYKNFRSLSVGAFSQDGQAFVGIFCWQIGHAISSRLVCFDLGQRRIRWERIFPSGIDDLMYDDTPRLLKISEHGTFTAVTYWDDVPMDLGDRDSFLFANVLVIDMDGHAVSKIRGIWLEKINDRGFIALQRTRDGERGFVDIAKHKLLLAKKGYRFECHPVNMLLLWDVGRTPDERHYYISNISADVLWDKMNPKLGHMNYSEDYRSIKGIGIRNDVISVYDISNVAGGTK